MNIVSGKTGKKRKKRSQSPSEERFNRAWRRVQNQQKKNTHLMDEVEHFVEKVEQRIGDRERQYADILYLSCEHLIGFYQRKSLTLWQRETLLDWLSEYLMLITGSPFSDHLDMNALQEKYATAIDAIHPPELQPAEHEPKVRPGEGDRDERGPQTKDMFEDLFSEFVGDDDDEGEPFYAEEDDPFDEFHREQREYQEARKQKTKSLSKLLKSSSVNKLFRKLARVLHPDLEQDEATRAHKNQLMGELIKARDSNDIPKIFSLYSDHVGESPLAELGGDLDTTTLLLQKHYEYLRDQEQELLAHNPRSGMIYQRFHHKDPRVVQRSVGKHLKELGQMITNQKRLLTEVTSVRKLVPLLEERHTMNMLGEVFGEFEAMYE
jgi:hypothetical protein